MRQAKTYPDKHPAEAGMGANGSPALSPDLIALARLLARQAARDLFEAEQTSLSSPSTNPQEDTDHED